MKHVSTAFVLAAMLCSIGVAAEETLCAKAETITFSCHIGKKILSICYSNHEKPFQYQYRFGRPSKVELTIAYEHGKFAEESHPLFGGGSTSLWIASNGYEYQVYGDVRRGKDNEPMFVDGLNVFKDGKTLSEKVCSDGGNGFREEIDWLPARKEP